MRFPNETINSMLCSDQIWCTDLTPVSKHVRAVWRYCTIQGFHTFKKQLKTEIFLLTSALKDLPHQISEGSVKTLSQRWCPDSARLNVNVSIGVGHLLWYGDGDTGATSRHYGVQWAHDAGRTNHLSISMFALHIKTYSCLASNPIEKKKKWAIRNYSGKCRMIGTKM